MRNNLTGSSHTCNVQLLSPSYSALFTPCTSSPRSIAMTSFLDVHCRYVMGVIRAVYYYLDANTFGMVPT